jgi:hypothetical protein
MLPPRGIPSTPCARSSWKSYNRIEGGRRGGTSYVFRHGRGSWARVFFRNRRWLGGSVDGVEGRGVVGEGERSNSVLGADKWVSFMREILPGTYTGDRVLNPATSSQTGRAGALFSSPGILHSSYTSRPSYSNTVANQAHYLIVGGSQFLIYSIKRATLPYPRISNILPTHLALSLSITSTSTSN